MRSWKERLLVNCTSRLTRKKKIRKLGWKNKNYQKSYNRIWVNLPHLIKSLNWSQIATTKWWNFLIPFKLNQYTSRNCQSIINVSLQLTKRGNKDNSKINCQYLTIHPKQYATDVYPKMYSIHKMLIKFQIKHFHIFKKQFQIKWVNYIVNLAMKLYFDKY